MNQITAAVESVRSNDDVKLLAKHIGILPDYLQTGEGVKKAWRKRSGHPIRERLGLLDFMY